MCDLYIISYSEKICFHTLYYLPTFVDLFVKPIINLNCTSNQSFWLTMIAHEIMPIGLALKDWTVVFGIMIVFEKKITCNFIKCRFTQSLKKNVGELCCVLTVCRTSPGTIVVDRRLMCVSTLLRFRLYWINLVFPIFHCI